MDIRRENGLRILVYRNRRIRPPQKGLGHGRPVIQLAGYFNICLPRIQGYFCNPLGPVHLIHIMHKDGFAAVLPLRQHIVHRKKSGRPVMLGPVEFNPSGNPWPRQPHQSRLYHMVIINKIISVRLIIRSLDPSSQLRQHHNLYIFIFQKNSGIFLIRLRIADFFHRRIGIDLSAASLIYPFIQKHRILFRFPYFISRYDYLFHPNLRFAHHVLHSSILSFFAAAVFRFHFQSPPYMKQYKAFMLKIHYS